MLFGTTTEHNGSQLPTNFFASPTGLLHVPNAGSTACKFVTSNMAQVSDGGCIATLHAQNAVRTMRSICDTQDRQQIP